MKEINSQEQLKAVIESKNKFIIYKHSTACSISIQANEEVKKWEIKNSSIIIYRVLVIEDRPISLAIAEAYGIKHASPQLLFIQNKKCLWHISHLEITIDKITEKVV